MCPEFILCTLHAVKVTCIKILIKILDKILTKIRGPQDRSTVEGVCLWTRVARKGDVDLLKSLLSSGIDKDATDEYDLSMLWHVVDSGNIEAVRYLLELGVALPIYAPEELQVQCELCDENRLILDGNSKQDSQDPCMTAICSNNLEIVKLLDEYGSQICKSFYALRRAVQFGCVDVVSYLLNKYPQPLNIEYIIKDSDKRIFTLLTEPSYECQAQITKILLDHGADPAKQMCAATGTNAIMTAIHHGHLEVIAQYIRSGVDINLRSWDFKYGRVSPFKASVLHDSHYVSEMLFISGCSHGVFSNCKLKANPKLEKLMKEWNVYENNVTPLRLRCRSVILNHLSPRADMKIKELPLPPCLIKFLSIPELDSFESKHNMSSLIKI